MLFAISSSPSAVLALVLVSFLAMLATSPMTAEAGCTFECAGISAKIVFCGNIIRNGVTDELPTIGTDSAVDNCLCNQDNVRLYSGCQACKDFPNALNKTNKFISDCKILNSNRILASTASSHFLTLSAAAVCIAIAVASASIL